MSVNLILGSASATRKQLLRQLGMPFQCIAADIDETPKAQESPLVLVERLAEQKAKTVWQGLDADVARDCCIIAADEVMVNLATEKTVSKPADKAEAIEQIVSNASQLVYFYTSLYLLRQQQKQYDFRRCVVTTEVLFARYDRRIAEQIYDLDEPLHCAGSFRSEGASVRLCRYIKEPEPGALMGLPLLTLNLFLQQLQAQTFA